MRIPSKIRAFVVIFIVAWIAIWTTGIYNVLSKHVINGSWRNDEGGFIAFWLLAWILGGIYTLGLILWTFRGEEQIRIGKEYISNRKQVFGIGYGKKYRQSEAKNVRVVEQSALLAQQSQPRVPFFLSNSTGAIAFDYGLKTIRIADDLDEAEAKHIVSEAKRRGYIKAD